MKLEKRMVQEAVVKFESGKTYSTRSVGDHNCVFQITVLKRTEKTVTVTGSIDGGYDGTPVRRRIFEYDGVECIRCGNYSFAPIWSADKEHKEN